MAREDHCVFARESGLLPGKPPLGLHDVEHALRPNTMTVEIEMVSVGRPRVSQWETVRWNDCRVGDDTWHHVLGVNLYGPFALCRAFLPGMVDNDGGVVVNIGSMASSVGGLGGAAYTASKHGMAGLTRNIAFFYGPRGIRCNLVVPGGVSTGIMASAEPGSNWAYERFQVQFARGTPIVEPDRIATVISWLGSDEASNVNGAIVNADGGMSAF